jgi:hypothetical protein
MSVFDELVALFIAAKATGLYIYDDETDEIYWPTTGLTIEPEEHWPIGSGVRPDADD